MCFPLQSSQLSFRPLRALATDCVKSNCQDEAEDFAGLACTIDSSPLSKVVHDPHVMNWFGSVFP